MQLPDGWVVARLRDLIPKARPKIPPDRNSHLPFIGMDHIEPNSLHLIGQDAFARMKSAGSYFQAGDVLYGRLRPYLNKVHRATFEGVASAEFIVLPSSELHDSDFVKYLLHQRRFVDFATSRSSGDRPRVKFEEIADFEFLLPPLNEQRRIAEKLEMLFARLAKGEEALRAVQNLLVSYRRSILKAGVTGKLTTDWRARNAGRLEHGRDLLERILQVRRETWEGRGKYREPAPPDTTGLPELPEEWIWASLAQLTSIKGGVTVDRKREATDPVTVPYLRVANVQNGFLDLGEIKEITINRDKAKQYLLQPGDILLNEGGDRDKLGRGWVWNGEISPCIHQNHIFRARPVLRALSSRFISYFANAFGQPFFMRNGKQSVNLASISLTAISRLPVPLPSLEEQSEIVARIEEEFVKVDKAVQSSASELVRSSALRQSILAHAFAGRLVPQDPADEPASTLLARAKGALTTGRKKVRHIAGV